MTEAEKLVQDTMSAVQQHMADYRAKAKAIRVQCLAELRELNISKVEANYYGCGDSGMVENIQLAPETEAMTDDLRQRLDELIWRLAYITNPGFEINEGGRGDFAWDIAKDSVCIDHWMVSEEHSSHEDL